MADWVPWKGIGPTATRKPAAYKAIPGTAEAIPGTGQGLCMCLLWSVYVSIICALQSAEKERKVEHLSQQLTEISKERAQLTGECGEGIYVKVKEVMG